MLLLNACQAAHKEVQVHVGQDDQGNVEWSTADDGPGANDEQLSWLTEPFSTTHFAQFGLGLALARRVVELHGGSVSAGNRPEGGFRVVADAAGGRAVIPARGESDDRSDPQKLPRILSVPSSFCWNGGPDLLR